MNTTALLKLADLNWAAALRQQVRWSAGAEYCRLEGGELALGATRFPGAPFNAVLRTSNQAPVARFLDEAERAFARVTRRFSVYTRGHADAELARECQRRGYLASGKLSIMVLKREQFVARQSRAQRLDYVTDVSGVDRFASIASDCFVSVDVPREAVRSAFSSSAQLLEDGLRLLIGSTEAHAAATALSLDHQESTGLYWLGTLPEARRRGLATACVAALAESAFGAGQRLVVVQAAPALAGFYCTLGFEAISELEIYTNLRRANAPLSALA